MAPRKGVDAHAIKMVAREIELSGYSKLSLKSDQEPAVRELIEAVKRERSEKLKSNVRNHPWGSTTVMGR